MTVRLPVILSLMPFLTGVLSAQQGTIPAFPILPSEIELTRLAQPGSPFNKVGRKFAVLGFESGTFEAWAWPLKLARNIGFSFFTGGATSAVTGAEIARRITVRPEATTITWASQSFTVDATWITPIDDAGTVILLDVRSIEPLTIVCSFLPVLQPMWPAGLGGQYAYWMNDERAYLISEPTRMQHAFIGSPAASGISYTPAHMLSDAPLEFRIDIAHPDSTRGRFIPLVIAGGKGSRDSVRAVYERLLADPEGVYRRAREHYERLRANTVRVITPDRELTLAGEWAKVSLDNLLADNPDLGRGLLAGLGASGTSGRPGFGWFFGGDACINAMAMLPAGMTGAVRDALAFARKWQRSDGKMAHELSQAASYVDWFGAYPYAYLHGDTTPLYLVAMREYLVATGDTAFIRDGWPSLYRAWNWCRSTDANGDGLMDNVRAGLASVEYGALTNPATDIFLGTLSVAAPRAMVTLADAAGMPGIADSARIEERRAARSFEEKFWDASAECYANAFNDRGQHATEITPWQALPALFDVGSEDHQCKTLERLSGADITSDWGVRSIASTSPLYEPLNYNYGAVWPFLTGFTATAQYQRGHALQGFALLRATAAHTFDRGLGTVTEVYSGAANIWPQEAVSQQGFSSTAVLLPLLRGIAGITPPGADGRVIISPRIPDDWRSLSVEHLRIGDALVSYRLDATDTTLTLHYDASGTGPMRIAFALADAVPDSTGDTPESLASACTSRTGSGCGVPFEEIPVLPGAHTVVLSRAAVPALLPPSILSRIGDPDRGLKLVTVHRGRDSIRVTADGPAGTTCALGVTHAAHIRGCDGCTISGDSVQIRFPAGAPGVFIRKTFSLFLR